MKVEKNMEKENRITWLSFWIEWFVIERIAVIPFIMRKE
jgi:hypothetical protein